ncbi:MAG TPA: hypothetical protein VK469_16720 [Candidatus Kapabacteria bacterium]|nr:hypothetical protein [Candidatus Kapabacteria bacterium]
MSKEQTNKTEYSGYELDEVNQEAPEYDVKDVISEKTNKITAKDLLKQFDEYVESKYVKTGSIIYGFSKFEKQIIKDFILQALKQHYQAIKPEEMYSPSSAGGDYEETGYYSCLDELRANEDKFFQGL